MFGALIFMSFCDCNFIFKHFKFLRTIVGKGLFNLFVASMFYVGDPGVWGIAMMSLLAGIGLFFVLIGCACVKGYE